MNLGNKKNFSPIIPFIIILAIIISLSPTAISAQENATNSEIQNITETTADNIEINLEENSICENNSQECSFPPYKLSYSNEIKENNIPKKALLISDNPGTNILNDAACDILNTYKDVDIQVRSCNQICKMNENELYTLVETSDIVIINWLTSDADSVFTNLLLKYPNLSNKELFLFLETSSSSQAKNLHLVRNSTINHKKIFSDKSIYTEEFLNKYFSMTKRGQNYDVYYEYITNGDGKLVNAEFNKAVLYKNYNNKENQINEILWALNITGYECKYSDPRFSKTYEYGIFREQYMTLEEYKKKYFDSSRPYTVGLLESNMYVSNGQLQPYYALIKSLEAKGCNVIPVVAAGGSENQLKVMVKYFTNAPSYEAYLNNPLKYTNNVNAIISMPAYGIGGNLFDNTTKYFETAGVPVFRAVHSDYVSNEEWELSATGLPGNRSDKWWHVAIGEAQGIIEATFVGGVTHEISSKTGAQLSGFKAHEKNIDLFTKRIVSWINLQYTVNSDKKISLVYFNYPPGKQNIGSSYLDSITSVYNLLYELKSQGYNVGKLPTTVKELEDMMIKSGINVATWAPGELEKLSNQPNIVLLPVAEYENWFNSLEPISKVQVIEGPVAYIGQLARNAIAINYTSPMKDIISDWYNGVKSLLPENYTESGVMLLDKIVAALNKYLQSGNDSDYQEYLSLKSQWKALNIPGLNGWGKAPGNIMTVTKNGVAYFVIPGLKFGNIFIAPEPQRGWEAKSDLLYHSSAVAPTHQYLAAYYYMQKEYSSAMVFIGRHATHEWLPGKEVLLSTTDYGSIVVGDVPQIYFYISDGLGEGLEAKRRGFAVMITHLTSPLAYTNLYGNLTAIANLINKYENTTDKTQKDTIASNIKLLIEKNNYIQSMGLTREEFEKLNLNEVVKAADKFLFEVQNTLYPLGLHAIGQNWTVTDISRSVVAALSQEFTYDGITTTIFDEVAKYLFSKKYSELNALERDKVLNTSEQIVAALIFSNSTTVANVLGSDNPSLIAAMNYARYYISLIYASINNELTSFINGLNGKYIPVVSDGDVININSLPTGGNFFHDQSQELPTEEAYNYAKTLT
ncbi:MAG: cobaltochelatase subunit CobN, partial [Methanobrevibacter sp.]|nr:cobaltochelatase subunit CobN [Methanobrevibacter sp.]